MKKGFNTLLFCLLSAGLLAGAHAQTTVKSATRDAALKGDSAGFKTRAGTARYIVVLDQPTLVREMATLERELGQAAETAGLRNPRGKMNLRGPMAQERLRELDQRFEEFRAEAAVALGRPLDTVHRYRVGLNGFSARLDAKEARRLAKMDGVRAVRLDEHFKLETDAGPNWIGAARVWEGEGFLVGNRGEGIVIGVIDSGINWEHNSFADPGEGQQVDSQNHDHENPYPGYLGLCDDPEVQCNDKLVGVYDFVEDDPDTEVVEEFNNGADNGTHGAHTASTAAGNPVGFTLINGAPIPISGVAPNANIISYRVCYAGDPDDFDDDACQGSAILAAIDQAIADGVDVINYSVGGGAFDPWAAPDTLAFLEAVEAGIFVATSAGNAGPVPGSMGRPANAPWITAVGSATHDRVLAGLLKANLGGDTPPPGDLVGTTFTLEAASQRPIVYAGDYGNALCGTGAPELQATCDGNTGATNPFPPGTFNGEIVVCDRGTYGRVEKGKNLLLAGAGGYVLANTEANGGEITEVDQHCLPSTHLPASSGDELREWLSSGSGHEGSLTGFVFFNDPAFADRMSDFSSRGPNPSPAEDVLKPNLIAPGDFIIAADNDGPGVIALGGTSMASPHVAGGAALLLANRPDLTPAQVASSLELTATDEIAKDEAFGEATPFDTGAGRPRLWEAAYVGLFLDESADNFRAVDPFEGGEPKNLNLATLTDADCRVTCSFNRTIGTFVNGRTWTVSTSGFPEGVEVTVTPESFVLLDGETADLEVTVDWSESEVAGQWIFGKVHIDNPNFPTATLPVSAFASLGDLPTEFQIGTNQSSGFEDVQLTGLDELSQANYVTGGLQEADEATFDLIEDPTWEDPFDGGQGVVTLLYDVPDRALWLHADTPASDSEDVDLYVGFDANNDGQAQENETVCISASFDEIEFCEIFAPQQGVWWVLVQNWEDGEDAEPGEGPAQAITLVSTVITEDGESRLTATGPGRAAALQDLELRLSWNDVSEPTGTTLFGAVGIASRADRLADVGVVPVRLQRQGIETPRAQALVSGQEAAFALRANTTHDKLFIDVPPGATGLTVNVAGGNANQSNALAFDLVPVPFDQAFGNAPDASAPPGSIAPAVSATGGGGQGPSATVNDAVAAGRWHVVLSNTAGSPAEVRITAEFTDGEDPIDVFGGLWSPSSRPGINQGFEYTPAGPNRAFLWYTYDQDGSATWYIASGPATAGNSWSTDLFRFTNDGSEQSGTDVGEVAITMVGEDDAVLTWNLFGVSGSDRVSPLSRTCPDVSPDTSYTGLWYRGTSGLGGASVIANRTTQAQIHYLYDAMGNPRWLLAGGDFASETTLPLTQFQGFCPNCSGSVTSSDVGTLAIDYLDNQIGEWTLDYQFVAPALGGDERNEAIIKLSDDLACAAPQ